MCMAKLTTRVPKLNLEEEAVAAGRLSILCAAANMPFSHFDEGPSSIMGIENVDRSSAMASLSDPSILEALQEPHRHAPEPVEICSYRAHQDMFR